MTKGMALSRKARYGFLIALVAAGTFLRVLLAWAPLEFLLRFVLADDSFYYLTIARNLAQGWGCTFDRLAPTNGFHPLWVLFLTPIYPMVSDPVLAIHLVLTVSSLIDTVAAIVLMRTLTFLHASFRVSILSLSLFVFTPSLLSHAGTLNGLETSLNVLLLFVFLLVFLKTFTNPTWTMQSSLHLGLAMGMLLLVRTDNIILVTLTGLSLAYQSRKDRRRARFVALAAMTAFLLTIPWIAWNLSTFGTIIQVSGVSTAYMTREILSLNGWGMSDLLLQIVRNLAGTAVFFPLYQHNTSVLSPPGMIALAFCMGITIGGGRRIRKSAHPLWSPEEGNLMVPFSAMAAGVVSLVVVQTLRAVQMKGWYYMSIFPLLLLIGAFLLDLSLREPPTGRASARQWRFSVVIVVLSFLFGTSLVNIANERFGEIDKYRLVRLMNQRLPAGSRIGSWNGGLYGYFGTGIQVINLDGLVNNGVYPSIRSHSLGAYCAKMQIRYLVDSQGAIAYAHPFMEPWFERLISEGRQIDAVFGEKENELISVIDLGEGWWEERATREQENPL